MNKIDLKKTEKGFYLPPSREPELIDIPEFRFLMIDGEDARPESPGFQSAITALFSVSYTVKFAVKKSRAIDYAVMPLEGLWWADDMEDFAAVRKERWKWTLMIRQPDFVTEADISEAIIKQRTKGSSESLDLLRFEPYREGPSGQILHIGPFSEEGPKIARIHALIEASGGRLEGKHHEIYLNDFRKVDPARMKTVLRQPYSKG